MTAQKVDFILDFPRTPNRTMERQEAVAKSGRRLGFAMNSLASYIVTQCELGRLPNAVAERLMLLQKDCTETYREHNKRVEELIG